jgi:hypothetical protein
MVTTFILLCFFLKKLKWGILKLLFVVDVKYIREIFPITKKLIKSNKEKNNIPPILSLSLPLPHQRYGRGGRINEITLPFPPFSTEKFKSYCITGI